MNKNINTNEKNQSINVGNINGKNIVIGHENKVNITEGIQIDEVKNLINSLKNIAGSIENDSDKKNKIKEDIHTIENELLKQKPNTSQLIDRLNNMLTFGGKIAEITSKLLANSYIQSFLK